MPQVARTCTFMPARPVNPEGGRAEKLFFVSFRGSRARADRLASSHGMTRSEYLRKRFEDVMAADEAALLSQEVDASAS